MAENKHFERMAQEAFDSAQQEQEAREADANADWWSVVTGEEQG